MGVTCSKDTGTAVVGAAIASSPDCGVDASDAQDESSGGYFISFSQLNDDVLVCILSYVSYAPFERDMSGTLTLAAIDERSERPPRDEEMQRLLEDYNAGATRLNKKIFKRKSNILPFRTPQAYYQEAFHGSGNNSNECLSRLSSTRMFGTLTHVLPLVNKRFHTLCNQTDMLWTEALERLIGLRNSQERSDIGPGDLWEIGIRALISSNSEVMEAPSPTDSSVDSSNDNIESSHDEFVRQLIPKACVCINKEDEERRGDGSAVKEVFRQVLLHYKPIRLPLFSMFCPVALGEEITLRLFEPRYRLMINEAMMDRSDRERNGFPLTTPRPRFLFACRGDAWRSTVACIVEVRRCLIRRDGMADITIVPISWEILEILVQRPESGGLIDGVILRSQKRTCLPAFCMRTHLVLDQHIRIRLFEERYKTMIAELFAGRSHEERNGGGISEPRPQFVFVCNNRFKPGCVAFLVDVERCRIHADGSAQVTVVPTSRVLVESVRKRPKSGNLYDASVLHGLPLLSQE